MNLMLTNTDDSIIMKDSVGNKTPSNLLQQIGIV